MKKLLIGLFIFGFIAISAPQVQASTLSDALLKIQNLTKEISQLKIKLKASVLGSSLDSQTIILKTGWNIISFNVNPSDLSLNSVFASMNPDNGEIITNEDAVTATYMNGSWGGGFTTIDTSKAYKIKVSRDKTLTVDGNLISINSSISLRSGTNLVPYYPTVEIDAVKAFSSIKTTCLKKVMDESGKTYEDFGVFGGWKNNIGTLKPGEGYTIITTGSCILNYGDVNKTSSITVLSPNGGETYTAGQQVIVKWKTENIPSNDKVIVVLDGESYDGYNMSGSDGTLNDGIETYYLYPNDKTINGRFKIRVLSINNDNLLDLSDNYFTIKPNLDTTTTPIAKITPTSDLTPRISYWSGKVNQHVNVGGGIWQTDPDGTSGATIDKLTYCKKWYPNTTSVVEYKNETINSWHDAGNVNDYQNTRMSYRCAETTIDIGCANGQVYSSTTGAKCLNNSTPSLTVLSPNGGETYNAGDKVIVKWKSTGYSSNSKIAVDLATTDSSGSSSNTHLMSVSNLDDDGVETLTIPNDVKTGSNYVLVFTIFETSTKWQMAKSNLFIINSIPTTPVTPSITVLSPNGGETYSAGQQITVKWKTENILIPSTVTVEMINNDTNESVLLGDAITLNGSVILRLPLNTNTWKNNKIKLTVINSKEGGVLARDLSDNLFTITTDNGCSNGAMFSSITGAKCLNNSTPSITVLSPNGGEVYREGDIVRIKWTSSNLPADYRIHLVFNYTDELKDEYKQSVLITKAEDKGYFDYKLPMFSQYKSSSYPLAGKRYEFTAYVFDPFSNSNSSLAIGTSSNGSNNGLFTIKPVTTVIDNGCSDGDRYSKTTGQLCGTTGTNTNQNPVKRILRWGVSGDDVKSLQEFLGIDADGVYGRGTASKVREWQASQGLYADGVFGNTSRQTAGLE